MHLIWVLNMFSLIIWVWWGNWQLNDIESFSPVRYVAMVLFSAVLYLMCGLLFPVRGREVEDFYEQFELNRSRFSISAWRCSSLLERERRLASTMPRWRSHSLCSRFAGSSPSDPQIDA